MGESMATREEVQRSLIGGCRDVYTRKPVDANYVACVGQVWQRGDGSQFRVQGYSRHEPGWIRVRECGGEREQGSYPPAPFTSGVFRLIR
jgi:hypothetical protein